MTLKVYGAVWCPDCQRSKKFLSELQVQYQWVDIEQDEQGRELVEAKNNGKRIIPTIVFDDETFLVEPSNAELARKLGLQTKPNRTVYDLIVIGGGPSGLTAALYAAREGIQTLVIDRSALGGQAGITAMLENFPGFPDGVSGKEFTERLTQQAKRFSVETLQAQDVLSIQPDGFGCHTVQLSDQTELSAYVVLIATGATYRRLNVQGEDDYIGAGVHYCATCDGPFYKGAENITVVGGGNSAAEESMHLLKFAERIQLLVRGDQLTASKTAADAVLTDTRIDIHYNAQVMRLDGVSGKLDKVTYKDQAGQSHQVITSAVFVFIGQRPNTGFVQDRVVMDQAGFIITGHDLTHHMDGLTRSPFNMETSIPGIFAAGDCRAGSTKQVASAVGEGASAAIAIREYLKTI